METAYVANEQKTISQTTTFELLLQKYPAVVKQEHVAEILHRSTRTIRNSIQTGLLPLRPILGNSKPLYKLSDVADFIDGKIKPIVVASDVPPKKRGRPLGSKNKPKAHEEPSFSPQL